MITGTTKIGNTLRAQAGSWTRNTQLAYQWYRNGQPIAQATQSTYKPVAADVGRNLSVAVTGAQPGYESLTKTSKPTSRILAGTLRSATPRISGTARVGRTLRVQTGTWTSGTTLSYQWLRDGRAIFRATRATYTPTASDRGKRITVRVTGKRSGYTTVSKTSARTAQVAIGTLKAPSPRISGSSRVGRKLTAQPGSWTSSTRLSYQWLRNGRAIPRATKKTYTLGANDMGQRISVRVTGRKAGYKTVSKTSARTAKIARGKLTGATPKISGTTRVGQTLRVSRGTWTHGTKFSYQWLRDGKAIRGATKSQYRLTSADRNKRISVRVTGSRKAYSNLSRTSARTSLIRGTTSSSRSGSSRGITMAPNVWNCPATHPVKGNRPSNGSDWKYHVKGQRFYNLTNPEECFRTPADARAAGYRASKV